MSKIWICRICGSGCFYERKPPKNDPIWKCGYFHEETSKDHTDLERKKEKKIDRMVRRLDKAMDCFRPKTPTTKDVIEAWEYLKKRLLETPPERDDDDRDRITLHLPPGKEPNVEIERKIKDLDIILTIENLTK